MHPMSTFVTLYPLYKIKDVLFWTACGVNILQTQHSSSSEIETSSECLDRKYFLEDVLSIGCTWGGVEGRCFFSQHFSIFLKLTFEDLNDYGVGPLSLWGHVKNWRENRVNNSIYSSRYSCTLSSRLGFSWFSNLPFFLKLIKNFWDDIAPHLF